MKNFLKKNYALVLAFLLPLVLIAVVAINAYVPSMFISTNYNFVYAACDGGTNYNYYNCDNYLAAKYAIEEGKLVEKVVDPAQDSDNDGVADINEGYAPRLFLHNTLTNESSEIVIDDAMKLDLNSLLTSPDGVTISSHYDRGADFFLFFDTGSSYGYYLTKGNGRTKLNLINLDDRYYYRENFHFIGWVLPGRQ